MAHNTKIQELKKRIEDLEQEIEQTEKTESKKDTSKGKKKSKKEEKEIKYKQRKVLYTWTAPVRIFIPRDKPWFLKVAILALLLILFFAFFQDFMVILVVCVLVLILFLLASIPPDSVTHQITNQGIKSIGKFFKWKHLKEFWVAEKYGQKIVYVTTDMKFPSRLVLLITKKDELTVVKLLMQELEYKEYMEKQGWLSKISDGEMIHPDTYIKQFKKK